MSESPGEVAISLADARAGSREALGRALDACRGCPTILAIQDSSSANYASLRHTRGLGKLNDPWGDLVNWAREWSVDSVKYRLFADAVNGKGLATA